MARQHQYAQYIQKSPVNNSMTQPVRSSLYKTVACKHQKHVPLKNQIQTLRHESGPWCSKSFFWAGAQNLTSLGGCRYIYVYIYYLYTYRLYRYKMPFHGNAIHIPICSIGYIKILGFIFQHHPAPWTSHQPISHATALWVAVTAWYSLHSPPTAKASP